MPLVASWAAEPGLPGIGARDTRQMMDLSVAPWRALGRVQTEDGERCTGALVAPNLVLTAAHCLVNRRTRHFVRPRSVHFLWRAQAGAYAAHAAIRFYHVRNGYDPATPIQSAGRDVAWLSLDHDIGDAADDLPIVQDAQPGQAVALGGYEQDHAERLMADTTCHVVKLGHDQQGQALIQHSCAATRGSSGGPVLRQDATGWRILGVQVLAAPGRGGIAVPFSFLPGVPGP